MVLPFKFFPAMNFITLWTLTASLTPLYRLFSCVIEGVGSREASCKGALRVCVLWCNQQWHIRRRQTLTLRRQQWSMSHFTKYPQTHSNATLLAAARFNLYLQNTHLRAFFALCEWGHEWSHCSNVCWWGMMMVIRRSIKGPRGKDHRNGDK